MSDELHPTVAACVSRDFCDATFKAAERRMDTINRLLDHIHGREHSGPTQGCQECAALLDRDERAA